MRKIFCADCKRALKKDERGLSQKLLDVENEGFYCIDCMAENIGCTVEDLEAKIAEFKEQGCTLFL